MRIPRSKVASLVFGALLVGNIAFAQEAHSENKSVTRIVRSVPRVPVILDGVEFPVGQMPNIDKGLTFVITAEDQEKGVVRAFSSYEVAKVFLKRSMENTRNNNVEVAALTSCQHPYSYSVFNKNRGGGGTDNIYMDMDQYTPTPTLYEHLDFDGWNNTISWVAAACNGYPTTLYSCRYFEMQETYACADPDRYLVSSGTIITDLTTVGFNNRTSSIKFGF